MSFLPELKIDSYVWKIMIFFSNLRRIIEPVRWFVYFPIQSKPIWPDWSIYGIDCNTFLHFDLESFGKFIKILRSHLNKVSVKVYPRFLSRVFSSFSNLFLKDLLWSRKFSIFMQFVLLKLQKLKIQRNFPVLNSGSRLENK